MLEIIKRQRGVLAFMLTLAMVLTTVGCNSKTALVEDGSPESKSVTYTEENIGTLKSEMQGNGSYTSVQLSAIKPVKSDDVTAIAWNKSTDLVMSVGQANLRTATTTPAGKKVAYTSSDTKVASVDATGNVYCLAPGEAVITAASGKKSVSYKITVTAAKAAPANAPATSAGKSGALVGYNITVYDNTTPAVTAAGNKIPIDKFYFYSADGKALGYMLGNEMTALQNKSVINNAGSWEAPGCGGDWQAWFAQQFNLYRGLGGNMGAAAGGVPNIGSGSAADEAPLFPIKTDADIEALRDEVIRLTNVEREKAGMPELEADDFTMDYAQIRAEEIVTSFSHVRPNNESDMPGGFSFMEIIHFGSPTASQAVQAWMKSPGHRVTLLCDYSDYGNRFGVGVYQTPNGNLYWVQEFLAWDPNA